MIGVSPPLVAVAPPAGDGRTRARSGSGSKPDHFRDQTPADAPESALIDQRVPQLIDMGFDGKKAERVRSRSRKATSMARSTDDDELNINPPAPCQIGKRPPAPKKTRDDDEFNTNLPTPFQ